MMICAYLAKDKSRKPAANSKEPVAEMKGVPVRVTTFAGAQRSHGAEAVLVLTRGQIRSVVATAGTLSLYLSPRAQFRLLEPDAPETEA